ncbi:MAG: hypothetical protein O7A68_01755 [Alphaproteobacteria bacterium]|nr:hypothetical protein [Alphaproteobacteria bacterium]
MISATLTPEQNRLVVLLLEIGNQSEAYRRTYDCSGMSAKTIRNRASEAFQMPHVAARLAARRRAQEGALAPGANRPTAPGPFPRLAVSCTAGTPTPQPNPEGSAGGDRLGAYGLGLNDFEEPIRDYERRCLLCHRFRLLRLRERTFLAARSTSEVDPKQTFRQVVRRFKPWPDP